MALAVGLVLSALDSSIALYVTPSEVVEGTAPAGRAFRVGGLVRDGSLKRDGLVATFAITDTVRDVPVSYRGILPDLFKEGKGAVAQGRMEAGVFVATEVLAKHDENYTPKEAQYAIDKAKGMAGR